MNKVNALSGVVLSVLFASATVGCSSQKQGRNADQGSKIASTPSVYMQVRRNVGVASVYSDMYLSSTVGGVGGGMPLIRNITKTLSNGVLVMRVNVRGGTLANQEVWIDASNVEARNQQAADAYRAEAEQMAQSARDAGAVAGYWEAAANAARFLCITGVGGSAALSIVTMGADTLGKAALVTLIGANTLKPLLDCAGIEYAKFGM